MSYLANPTRYNLSIVYVSSVSANGIPVGSDATGDGSIGAPFLTFAVALASLARPGEIRFNGTSQASPTTYTLASSTLTLALTLCSAVAGQRIATLAGGGATAAFTLSPTNGELISFVDVNIDPSLNVGGGPAARCLSLTSQSTTYSVILTNVKCQNWTTYAVYAPSAAFKGNITVTDGTFTGGSVSGAINLATQDAGSLTVNGSTSVTITLQQTASVGAIVNQVATSSGVSSYVKVTTASLTLDPALSGAATHYGIVVRNVANALIDGGTHTCTGPTSRQVYMTGVSQGASAPFLSIANSTIQNVTVNHSADGGIAIFTSQDSSGYTRSLAPGCIVQDCIVDGTGGTSHGIFLCAGEDQIARRNSITNAAIALPAKYSTRPQIYQNTVTGATSSYSQWKGSQGVVQYSNVWTSTASHSGVMFSVLRDTATLETSDGTITGDQFVVNGATNIQLGKIEDTSTATVVGCDWQLTSGTLNAHPWVWQGANVDLFNGVGGWQADHGPTDTSNIP